MSIASAILASGEGTTAEAFIRAAQAGQVDTDVKLVICNKPEAGIFERISRLNTELGLSIRATTISSRTHPAAADETLMPGGQTQAEEAAIIELLRQNQIELVLLMGYLRRVGPALVKEYGWRASYTSPYQARMLNTHPGLLPATKGLWGIHVQKFVVDQKLAEGGQTLHIVAEDYDEGPIVAENRLAVGPGDTADMFFDRVKAIEKQSLPGDVQAFIMARSQYMQT